jgi:hypothetical protein
MVVVYTVICGHNIRVQSVILFFFCIVFQSETKVSTNSEYYLMIPDAGCTNYTSSL